MKLRGRWRSAQSVDALFKCSLETKKIQELDLELCASIIHAAAPDVPKEILQMCGTAVDLIEFEKVLSASWGLTAAFTISLILKII